jgi:hypothetical protein
LVTLTQQIVIEPADGLDRFPRLLIAAQPKTDLINPLAAHAELTRASFRVGHRQNETVMPFAARAFRASLRISDGAFQQRAAQDWRIGEGVKMLV